MQSIINGKTLSCTGIVPTKSLEDGYQKKRWGVFFIIAMTGKLVDSLGPQKQQRRYFNVVFVGPHYLKMHIPL